MFKHILLPTDGSKLSEKSVKQGVRMAKALNAKVTALHVVPKFHTFTYHSEMLESTRREFEAEAAAEDEELPRVRQEGRCRVRREMRYRAGGE